MLRRCRSRELREDSDFMSATVSAAWGAYGASAGFYYNKAKAENTTGGIVFEAACGRQARSGQDCDGWEENG